MTEHTLFLLHVAAGVFWVACGILAIGIYLANDHAGTRQAFSFLPEEALVREVRYWHSQALIWISILLIICGPFGLLAVLTDGYHGITYRKPRLPKKEEKSHV